MDPRESGSAVRRRLDGTAVLQPGVTDAVSRLAEPRTDPLAAAPVAGTADWQVVEGFAAIDLNGQYQNSPVFRTQAEAELWVTFERQRPTARRRDVERAKSATETVIISRELVEEARRGCDKGGDAWSILTSALGEDYYEALSAAS